MLAGKPGIAKCKAAYAFFMRLHTNIYTHMVHRTLTET